MKRREKRVQQGGQAEKQDEPGPLDARFGLEGKGGDEGKRNDPEGASKLDGGGDGERAGAIFRGSTNDGAGVVDGQRGPQAELLLGHVEQVSEDGKHEKRDGVEDKDSAESHGHFFVVGLSDRSDCGDSTAAADGGTRADEKCGLLGNVNQVTEPKAEQHRQGDAGGGVEEAGASGLQDFVQVHAEAEGYDGGLQQEFREVLAFDVKRMGERKSVDQATQKSKRWGDQATRRQDDADEEEVPAHRRSVALKSARRPSRNVDGLLAGLIETRRLARRLSRRAGKQAGAFQREGPQGAGGPLRLRTSAREKSKVSGDVKAGNVSNFKRAKFEFLGNGPAGDETKAETCFHRGFDGLRGVEVDHFVKEFQFEGSFFEGDFDDTAGSGTLLAHQED